jgi:hypothetical protein
VGRGILFLLRARTALLLCAGGLIEAVAQSILSIFYCQYRLDEENPQQQAETYEK